MSSLIGSLLWWVILASLCKTFYMYTCDENSVWGLISVRIARSTYINFSFSFSFTISAFQSMDILLVMCLYIHIWHFCYFRSLESLFSVWREVLKGDSIVSFVGLQWLLEIGLLDRFVGVFVWAYLKSWLICLLPSILLLPLSLSSLVASVCVVCCLLSFVDSCLDNCLCLVFFNNHYVAITIKPLWWHECSLDSICKSIICLLY